MSKGKKFELSINHPVLDGARLGFDACLKAAIGRAIHTGSMEGSASVKVSFEIFKVMNQDTGEWEMKQGIKYKATYSVPMKDSIDGDVRDESRLVSGKEGEYMLVNNQVSMTELMAEGTEE